MPDATPARVVRVLQVIDRLDRGGAETWLLGMLQRLDRTRFACDVLVHTEQPQPYDAAVRATGSRILPCLRPARPWQYARNFARLVRTHGPYDVVHCHTHHWNGVVLRLARRAGIPVRVPHSRTEKSVPDGQNHLRRRIYAWWMTRWIHRYATAGLAVSDAAAVGLFGPGWQRDGRYAILRSALDLTPFRQPSALEPLPAPLNDPQRPLVLHVGRFDPQKNHSLVLAVMNTLARLDERLVFALVGAGPLEAELRQMASQTACGNRLAFLGLRADIPALLARRAGVLLLPSLFEGLPRVAVEAQAAGVPVVLADSITRETEIVAPLVHWLSLKQDAGAWAARVLDVLRAPRPINADAALVVLEASDFNLERNVAQLERLYLQWAGVA